MATALSAALATIAFRVGITVDEPSHLVSSFLYWDGNDWLKPADMPPLLKLSCGWVPHLTGIPLPGPNHEVWTTGHEWNVSQEMMNRMAAPEIRRVFGLARLPMIVYPVGCCVLLWWWARQLFSSAAALLAALLVALSPTVLGHGALVKNDVAAAFAFLLFWYRLWVFARAPVMRNAAWLGAALAVALITKFSLQILVPIAPAGMLVVLRHKGYSRKAVAAMVLVVFLIPYVTLLATYQFRFDQLHFTQFQAWKDDPHLSVLFVKAVRVLYYVGVPAPYLRGMVSLVQSNADGAGVYLMGSVYPKGNLAYFLIALGSKVPLATQLLILTGFWLVFRDRRSLRWRDACWMAPAFLYLGLASASSLQLGVRLVLPALVFLVLISGKALQWFARTMVGRGLVCALVVWLVWRNAAVFPNEIAFFNRLAGGPENGLAVLSDSNLDWGQDLPRLAEYVRSNGIRKIHVAYFGSDNPWAHLGEDVIDPVAPPWSDEYITSKSYRPKPGLYAISGTLLTGQFFREEYRNYFAEFRRRRPVGKAGHSIWIYRVQ